MYRWLSVAVWLVACRGTTSDPAAPRHEVAPTAAAPIAAAAPAPPPVCGAGVPAAACARQPGLSVCAAGDRARIGEWRYAVIAPMYAPLEDLTSAQLAAAWQRGELAATADTAAAVTALLGPGAPPVLGLDDRPALDARHLAIVPADQLVPAWKAIAIDGHHPLDPAPGALAVPLCAADPRRAVRNIDPAQLTSVAITGVTAMTRLTAELMDRKGVTYPIKDVEPWLAAVDLVHISNEVSFVGKECKPYKSLTTEFCSREGYIKLLEAAHARIIELDGSHLPDYGRPWIDHTLDIYQQHGWVWFGGGRDQLDGTAPRIVEHHGNKLGFLGCNMPWTTARVITEGPGVAACDLERIKWQIGELARQGIVPIVSIQHEEVYHHDPPDEIVRDFRALADAGAAVVNGSQAHCAHPWEVHHGAYVHYGGGNFLFDQQATNTQDATLDKLYIHANRLLSVGHLYTRLEEHGRPRPMTPRERTGYLATMAGVLPRPIADPWAAQHIAPASRQHPDSFLVGKQLEHIAITAPTTVAANTRYPLIVDLTGHTDDDTAYVVRPRRPLPPSRKLADAIARFVVARYAGAIDADRVTVRTDEAQIAARKATPMTASAR
jgi:hypothetical protein